MKQEILCPKCAEKLRATFPTDDPFPGEHVKFVPGTAVELFMCDGCGQGIPESAPCTAFSSWADYGGIPYYTWEEEYIEVN